MARSQTKKKIRPERVLINNNWLIELCIQRELRLLKWAAKTINFFRLKLNF